MKKFKKELLAEFIKTAFYFALSGGVYYLIELIWKQHSDTSMFLIGGIIGILFGMAIIKFVIGSFDLITPVYSVPWIIASFTISLVIGVIFGIFPAYKAAKLNPIEALRSE